MKASELVLELQKYINEVGDTDVVIVHPTGTYKELCVLDGSKDYYNEGYGLLGGDCVSGCIVIDYI